ncbi:GNAT family N-acetyltransferase [Priestia taiwanensis]|uniref:N-acetyltransferase n=1 Tax=Priestia taiwanensis TaxID=1347902 RepID=A0A917AJX3_9BACI|nr:GNAT family N-acetyltransferase [Priestia taiwanensis]MBM7361927.1 RimJ/RimL family protein N-acetyltransferase [Priestia taiwanensis]GGE58074.1 N-acetyltransferase [Priestia taiwanensis]
MIILRPLKLEDYENVLAWSKDDTFCQANGWERNRNEEELHMWWERCVTNNTEDFHRLGIEGDGQLIGYVDLACIRGTEAEIGIAIGESGLWGKGIGVHSILSLIEYAEKEYSITTLIAETHEANTRSRKMLERVGFTEVSRIGVEEYMGKDSRLIQYKLDLLDSQK